MSYKRALSNIELIKRFHIVFIRSNAAAFIKIFMIQEQCLFEGCVYLKCNLLFANNSMVTDQKKRRSSACSQFHNLRVDTTAILNVK